MNWLIHRNRSILGWAFLSLFLFLAITHRELMEQITSTQHIFHDTDDAMRLVQVRDWLAGQSWWDLHQYRLYPAEPIIMHWSRLVDVPIAGLILIFEQFVGRFQAELITRIVWPLILFGVFSVFYFKLCSRLAGQGVLLYAATLLLMNVYVTAQFVPGRIDHHSVQLACLMASLWLTFGAVQTRRNGFVLGGIMALMLIIGYETVPLVVGFGAVIVLRWVRHFRPNFMRYVGFGLCIGLFGLYFLTHPLAQFWQRECDAIAMPGLILFGGAGIVMVFLGVLRVQNWLQRLLIAIIGGIACMLPFALFAPHCLSSPYEAVDPILRSEWLSIVQEAQPLIKAFESAPENTLPLLIYSVFGAFILLYCILKRKYAFEFILYLILYIIAFATTIWQIRGGFFLLALAMPIVCVVISDMHSVFRAEAAQALARMAILLPCVPFLWAFGYEQLSVTQVKLHTEHSFCMDNKAIEVLKKQPKGLVFAPMDLGPNILAMTQHSVISAPYHRNNAGNMLGFQMKKMLPSTLINDMLAQKISYAYLCLNTADYTKFIDIQKIDILYNSNVVLLIKPK